VLTQHDSVHAVAELRHELCCFDERRKAMRGLTLTGVLLVALGLVLLAGPVFTYTKHEKVVDVGPIEVTAANRKHVSLPPVLGGVALVVGAVLLVSGAKRGRP